MGRMTIVDSDNRDSKTTWIWLSQNNYVEIDPQDYMMAMIQNLPPPLCDTYEKEFAEFTRKLEADLEEYNANDNDG